jgi:putative nucleotidyltransferase with HDIG domain
LFSVETILKSVTSLPTLPVALTRLTELARDDQAEPADFVRVIRHDAAVAANLLRVANSALFHVANPVTSIEQAVNLLGTRRVVELATGASFGRIIPKVLPGYDMTAEGYWTHCAAVAILGEQLASSLGNAAPDAVFTCGLLHDIGKLVLGTFLMQVSGEIQRQLHGATSFLEAERLALGTDHAEVGVAVAARWQLPPPVVCAIRSHHAPSTAESDQTVVDLVHVADGLAHALGFGADRGGLARTMDSKAMARLGLRVHQLEEAAALSLDSIHGMAEWFSQSDGGKP